MAGKREISARLWSLHRAATLANRAAAWSAMTFRDLK